MPAVRKHVNTAKIDKLDIHTMYMTMYHNTKGAGTEYKADWITKIGLVGVLRGKEANFFANYYSNTKGMQHVLKYGSQNCEKYDVSKSQIECWHKETMTLFKSILKDHAIKDSRGRPKMPTSYTAGLRYSTGSKGYAPNAAALIVVDDKDHIVIEVIKIGDFLYQHTPVKNTGRVSAKLKSGQGFKSCLLENGYSFSTYNQIFQDDEDCEGWGDFDEEVITEESKTEDFDNIDLDTLLASV
ncbi:hypothetical protein C9E85_14715 [Plesiomonas shigelloides]|nr:hypothetical protein C9E85_14715 [Plesiomonas shigelloides]